MTSIRETNKIFYHADDMGATHNITFRIIEAWEKGLLDGFSIFADSDFLYDIKKTLSTHPDRGARIAVHLNLWEGKPLLAASDVPRLVDKDGYFKVDFLGLFGKYLMSSGYERSMLLEEIANEWRAQIKKVCDTVSPRVVTAIDSHLHIHMLPFLFRIASQLAKEFAIPEIRLTVEPFYFSSRFSECLSMRFVENLRKHVVLAFCVYFDRKIAKKFHLLFPDAFIGVLYSGIMSKANVKKGILAAEKKGSAYTEILMHIGRAERTELGRWKMEKKKASFVLSPMRDREYSDLATLRGMNND